jgi:cAMP phosphodiesterase
MKIKVLGCSGAEFPGSNFPSFLLDEKILFDAGSITNVLDEGAQSKIEYIFVTHAHLDHIKGIPFLADNIIVGNMRHKVTIMSIPPVINTIKKHLLNSSVWPDFTAIPHPEDAILNLVKLKNDKPIRINDYTITPYEVNHTVSAVGYLVEDKKKRRFFYTGDIGRSGKTWEKIGDRQIHCLIIDVSFPNNMEDVAIRTGHLTPHLLKEELLKVQHMPEFIYITHLKPQHFKTIKTELDRLKMKKLRLLRDGDTIRI